MSFLFDGKPFQFDAFLRSRGSEILSLFDCKQLANSLPIFWDDQEIDGAGTNSTYNTNQSSTTISVSNATAGRRARRTKQRFPHQPGKSALYVQAFVLAPEGHQAAIVRRVGPFDDQNGLYWESDGSQAVGAQLAFGRRTFTSGVAVDTRIPQSSWNIDKLNGSGPSGKTLDVAAINLWFIDFSWAGSVRFGVFLDGAQIYCHREDYSNNLNVVFVQIPNLPLSYDIANSGAGAAATLVHVWDTVVIEGGREEVGLTRTVNRGSDELTDTNTTELYPLLMIRLQSGFPFANIVPVSVTVVTLNGATFFWQTLFNPTFDLGSPPVALSWTPVPNSPIEYAAPDNNITIATEGIALQSGYASGGFFGSGSGIEGIELSPCLRIGTDIAGVSDMWVLAVRRLDGALGEDFFGSINWREFV